MDIKIGSVVQLKSGGPKMTVQNIGDYSYGGNSDNGANCSWFAGDEHKSEVFTLSALRVINDEDE